MASRFRSHLASVDAMAFMHVTREARANVVHAHPSQTFSPISQDEKQ